MARGTIHRALEELQHPQGLRLVSRCELVAAGGGELLPRIGRFLSD